MQLGFSPLRKAGLIDAGDLIADCKSGVSGAGRKAEIGTLARRSRATTSRPTACQATAICRKPAQGCKRFTGRQVGLIFTPHLVPMIRGMHSTLYATLAGSARRRFAGAVRRALRRTSLSSM